MGLKHSIKYDDENHLKTLKNRSKGEKMTRLILESLFKVPFITVRPDFLSYKVKNKKKTKLEIDLYNENLGLGVEYQGEQHFIYTPYFHKTQDGFVKSTKRDQFKRKMCHSNGIYLVEIHDFVKVNKLGDHILDSLPHRFYNKIDKKGITLLNKGRIIVLK